MAVTNLGMSEMQTGVLTPIDANAADTATGDQSGVTLIQPGTPLTRLNYYDGKFLRASDLQGEQAYFRELVSLSNQAGGPGVVYGLDLTLASGDQLNLSAGLGIGPGGRVLYLPNDATVSIAKLIEATSKISTGRIPLAGGGTGFADCIADSTTPAAVGVVTGVDLYLITVCYAEGLCGEEDVYGKLCEEACVTSTDRPFRVDGVVLRATPLVLTAPLATSNTVKLSAVHQRSLIASAYFETERTSTAHHSLIGGDGLRSGAWCLGAGYESGCGVPVGVLARAGRVVLFLDEWTGRRERIDPPPRSYWAWKMMMRPWNVFLAQMLQFQCQLHEVLGQSADPGAGDDACSDHEAVLAKVNSYLADVRSRIERDPTVSSGSLAFFKGGMTGLADLTSSVSKALVKVSRGATDRVLIRGGIVELPPAGYLPVVAGTSVAVNDQVRALLGEGVDLRFCIVRPDYVAHALETAQHMERISLLAGLDDPTHKPEVDILVPDGAVDAQSALTDHVYDATMHIGTDKSGTLSFRGAARSRWLENGGRAFHLAAIGQAGSAFSKLVTGVSELKTGTFPAGGLAEKNVGAPVDFTNKFIDGAGTVTDALRRMRFDRLNMTGAYATPQMEAEPVQPVLSDYLTKGGPNVDGAWLTIRTDRPLSTLGPTTPAAQIFGRLVIGNVLRSVLTGFELSLTGTASFVREYPDLGSGRRVDVILSMTLTANTIKETATTELEMIMARRITQPLSITFTGDDDVGEAVSQLLNAMAGIRITTDWGSPTGTARSNVATVTTTTPPKEVSLVDLSLDEDASVMDETSGNHRYATTGIAIVQSVLFTEDSFEHDALAALFAPLAGADDLAIRATTDWVLFHRRRTKQCKAPPVPKPAEPPRQYRVFEITAASQREALDWYQRAQSTDPAVQQQVAAKLGLRVLARVSDVPDLVVEFEGGLSTMRSDPDAIAADWPRFSPGSTLAYALVARPHADRTLELARLGAVETAIPSTTDTTKLSGTTYLTSVPTGWADASTDGSMLFITIAAPPISHHVLGVQNQDVWKSLQQDLRNVTSPAAAMAVITRQMGNGLFDLGTVLFIAGGSMPTDASQLTDVKTKFHASLPTPAQLGIIPWLPTSDTADATTRAMHIAQAQAIGNAVLASAQMVPNPLVNADVDPSGVTIGTTPCTIITFLLLLRAT